MLESQVSFARAIAAQCGIEHEMIADIIQVGDPGHRWRVLLGGRLWPEMPGDGFDTGDP